MKYHHVLGLCVLGRYNKTKGCDILAFTFVRLKKMVTKIQGKKLKRQHVIQESFKTGYHLVSSCLSCVVVKHYTAVISWYLLWKALWPWLHIFVCVCACWLVYIYALYIFYIVREFTSPFCGPFILSWKVNTVDRKSELSHAECYIKHK